MARNYAWIRHGNEVAQRYHGTRDADRVFAALKEAVELAKAEGVTYMATDEELMNDARIIASDTKFSYSA